MFNHRAKAYSAIELIMVVLFAGILAAIAIPRLNFSAIRKSKASVTAQQITTGLRRVRSMSLADAADNPYGFSLTISGSSYSIA